MEPNQPYSQYSPNTYTSDFLCRNYLEKIIQNPFAAHCRVSLFEAYDAILQCTNGTAAKECSDWNPQGTFKDLTLTIARIAGEATHQDIQESLTLIEKMMGE